ncbi:MAG: TetR/AcrR family transcriptional regulator [Alcaligenaceae bacterium]|nr:MAG: TetR/AcrR family transcriptional regulator [Alcaligenaceae bacterium]
MVNHAVNIQDKEARSRNILAAALELFLVDTRQLPTVDSVARRSGLAKGTIYLYFSSKEHIFASLLAREWHELLSVVGDCFKSTHDPQITINKFITEFCRYLSSHPYFLRLDSMGYALLEAKLPSDEFWDFKNRFITDLELVGSVIDRALSFDAGRGLQLVSRSYALTRGLWQLSDHPDTHRAHPDFVKHPFAQIDFGKDLKEALFEYWAGAAGGG